MIFLKIKLGENRKLLECEANETCLQISDIGEEDAGSYECRAENEMGQQVVEIQVNVRTASQCSENSLRELKTK